VRLDLARLADRALNRDEELIRQLDHAPSFILGCRPCFIVRLLPLELDLLSLANQPVVEETRFDEHAAKLVPRADMCLGIDVALAERGAGAYSIA
jgi:hypothetical protein